MAFGIEIHDSEGVLIIDNSSLIARVAHYQPPSGPYYYGNDYYNGANYNQGGGWSDPNNPTENIVCCNGDSTVCALDYVMPAGLGFSTSTCLVLVKGPIIKVNMDGMNVLPSNNTAIRMDKVFHQPTEITSNNYVMTRVENGSCLSCGQDNDWDDARNAIQVIVAYFG